MSEPLLSLSVSAEYGGGSVLRNLALEVGEGEIVGLVGQSGCGKSTLALAILKLLHLRGGKATGSIVFSGHELITASERRMRAVRGKEIGLVLQSPMSALNPTLKIGTQLSEAWKAHRNGSREERRRALLQVLSNVSLPATDDFLRRYPRQLSVGQAQRVLIAMAVLHRPGLLIADEPTSALDILTQSEILELFRRLNRDMAMAILYISHDLLSVATIADRVAVMHQGEIVEFRTTQEIFAAPQHTYTQSLIASLPIPPALALTLKQHSPGQAKSHAATRL